MYFDERENNFSYSDEEENNFVQYIEDNSQENTKEYKISNNTIYDIDNININNFRKIYKTKLFNLSDGFNKGNLFVDLYNPYKNYSYKIIASSEREKKLLKIQELTFAVKDLNLYLDIYPEDAQLYDYFKNLNIELKKCMIEYESMYGPLVVQDTTADKFNWIQCPWPWDKGENRNV